MTSKKNATWVYSAYDSFLVQKRALCPFCWKLTTALNLLNAGLDGTGPGVVCWVLWYDENNYVKFFWLSSTAGFLVSYLYSANEQINWFYFRLCKLFEWLFYFWNGIQYNFHIIKDFINQHLWILYETWNKRIIIVLLLLGLLGFYLELHSYIPLSWSKYLLDH